MPRPRLSAFSFQLSAFMLFMAFMVQSPALGQCGPGGCRAPSAQGRAILPGINSQPAAIAEPQPEAVARVEVTTRGGRGASQSMGTGTLIARDATNGRGYVVTCWHLFRDGRGEVLVRFRSGAFIAKLLAAEEGPDLALLEIADPGIDQVAVAEEFPRPGEPLQAGGLGPDGRWRAVRGTLAGYRSTSGGTSNETLEMSGAARDGDSGGPVFNGRGELAGVLWGTDKRVIEATYCGRVRQFFIETLRRAGQPPPPGPVRRVIPGLCKPQQPAAPPAAPTFAPPPPDPRVGEGVDVLRSIDGRAASIDVNVGKIEGYLRPDEKDAGLKPGLVALAIVLALVVGGALFYGTQKHSPVA
jgi:hypothetical protein